jgi:hypothetical protein
VADEEVAYALHGRGRREIPGHDPFIGSAEYVSNLHEPVVEERSNGA